MKKQLLKLFLLLFVIGNVQCSENDSPLDDDNKVPEEKPEVKPDNGMDFEALMMSIRADNNNTIKDDVIRNILNKYNASDGSFSDIDYNDKDYGNWKPSVHVDRLRDMAFAYTNKTSAYYQKEDLYNKIVQSLECWYKKNLNAPNWWFNEISEPKTLGITLIWMRKGAKQIPAELEKKTLDRIRKEGNDPDKKTGANRTDIALHWIYRSCLTENQKDLNHAFSSVFKTLELTTGEGIQHDYTFFQHGPQIYLGGYGDEFLKGVTLIANYAINTPFALSGEKLDILSSFMCDCFYLSLRGGYMPFGVLGRGVSRPNGISKRGTSVFAKRMQKIDVARASQYQKIIDRLDKNQSDYGVEPKHTHFYRADYTLHVRPKYSFDVRMASRHTARCENGNGENLKGYYIADGSTNIMVDGDEYLNIFPAWNWAQVPGTTAPQTKIPMTDKWGVLGSSNFAGGVSDGVYGASAYSYYDKFQSVNTGANKSWYFFDDEVVCLGNVTSASGSQVKTTINQCLAKGKAVTVNDGESNSTLGKTSKNFDNPAWVHHNKVGYVFPKGGNVWVNNTTQSGSWYDINTGRSKDNVSCDVFSVGFDYQSVSTYTPYAYIVVPAVTSASEVETYAKSNAVEIITNTQSLQAVYHNKLKILQSVFFVKGTMEYKGLSITANRGCIVMLKETAKGKYNVYVANPSRIQTVVELTFTNADKVTKTINADFKGSDIHVGKTKDYTLAF